MMYYMYCITAYIHDYHACLLFYEVSNSSIQYNNNNNNNTEN